MDKRDIAVTIKISKGDLALLQQAAAKLWPGAMMTRSTMVLSLALLGAKQVEKARKRP